MTGLILRVAIGIDMLYHGLQKTFGFFDGNGLAGTVNNYKAINIIYPVTILIILSQTIGAVMLILGFLGRINAAFTFIVMTGAFLILHRHNGFSINWTGNQKGEGYEMDMIVCAMCSIIIIKGSGKYSIDRMLSRNR